MDQSRRGSSAGDGRSLTTAAYDDVAKRTRRLSQQSQQTQSNQVQRLLSQQIPSRHRYDSSASATASLLGRRQSQLALLYRRRMSYASSYRLASERDAPSVFGRTSCPRVENTYQLMPHVHERFHPCYAEPIIAQVLQSYLDGETYEARQCVSMSRRLSEVIRDRVKTLRLPRYKLVCTVLIGQNSGQALQHASRCLLDADNDGFASASYENSSLFASATVYAIYYD